MGDAAVGAGSRPEPTCCAPAPQQDPYLWNELADGKLLYQNAELLCAVRDNKDKTVREFWRLLAICHTVMVQEEDSECTRPLPPEGARAPGPLACSPGPRDGPAHRQAPFHCLLDRGVSRL